MGLKIFYDAMSQPSRAIVIFCRANSLPVEEVRVNIAKGENRASPFNSIYPLCKLPVLSVGLST